MDSRRPVRGRSLLSLVLDMPSRLLVAALAALLSLAAPTTGQQPPAKMGYIDVQRVLADAQEAKAAKAALQKRQERIQQDLDAEQAALRKEAEALEAQKKVLDRDVHERQTKDLQARMLDLMKKLERLRSAQASTEHEAIRAIVDKIQKVVATIAARDGYAFVFQKDEAGLLFALPQYDLTAEVVRTCDATPPAPLPKSLTDEPAKK